MSIRVAGSVFSLLFLKAGGFMSKILLIEFADDENSELEEILVLLNHYPKVKQLSLKNEAVISFPGLEIRPECRAVYCDCKKVHLTVKEYDILCLLIANKGRVLTYEQIYQNVWNELPEGSIRKVILYHVINLRKKLSMVQGLSIKCVREIGYCLELSETEEKSK